jgi:hypothetical protein
MCDLLLFLRKWLNAIGLSLGLVGVVFIWIWGPPQPSFERGVSIVLEDANRLPDGRTAAQYAADTEAQERHYRFMSRVGLGLILAGFALQLINEFVPRDH